MAESSSHATIDTLRILVCCFWCDSLFILVPSEPQFISCFARPSHSVEASQRSSRARGCHASPLRLLPRLPHPLLHVLLSFRYIIIHIWFCRSSSACSSHVIFHQENNKMNKSNMSALIGPNIMRRLAPSPLSMLKDVRDANVVCLLLYDHYNEIFANVL